MASLCYPLPIIVGETVNIFMAAQSTSNLVEFFSGKGEFNPTDALTFVANTDTKLGNLPIVGLADNANTMSDIVLSGATMQQYARQQSNYHFAEAGKALEAQWNASAPGRAAFKEKVMDLFVDLVDKTMEWHHQILNETPYTDQIRVENGCIAQEAVGLCSDWMTKTRSVDEWIESQNSARDLIPTLDSSATQAKEAKIERQRVEAERQRAEAERQRVEAERQRAEAERQRAEAERQRAEAERQRAEAESQQAHAERLMAYEAEHQQRLFREFFLEIHRDDLWNSDWRNPRSNGVFTFPVHQPTATPYNLPPL